MDQRNFSIPNDNSAIIDRIICLFTLICMLLLGMHTLGEIEIDYTNDTHRIILLSYKASMQIISILVFIKMAESSIIRDMIDISIYCLLYEVVILESFLLNVDLFNILADAPSQIFHKSLHIFTLLRIVWITKDQNGRLTWSDWPPIGPFGLTYKKAKKVNLTKKLPAIVASMIISIELAIILLNVKFGWYNAAPALAGLCLVVGYGQTLKSKVNKTIAQQEADAKTIAEYRKVIMNASEAIEYLERNQSNETKKTAPVVLTIVKE